MAIFADGTNVDTIGGGSAEASVLKLASELLPDGVAIIKECNLDDREADSALQKLTSTQQPICLETVGAHTYLVETLGFQSTMFILGGGHVARPTAALASMVGFQTVALDDRSEFANSDSFPDAQEIVILPGFDDPFRDLTIDENSYIVIATRGHAHDQSVLSKALETSAAYIGMIGSRRKINCCFESLKEQGVDEAKCTQVHTPIGINIGSETPEEIGVSIVGELIQVRNQLRSGEI